MAKFRVKFNFQDERIIEAEDSEIAIEKFCEHYEDEIAKYNETLQNRVYGTLKATKM